MFRSALRQSGRLAAASSSRAIYVRSIYTHCFAQTFSIGTMATQLAVVTLIELNAMLL
jgi:hypothetical protein